MSPHIWTQTEIEAAPKFEEGAMGWFYGFVEVQVLEDEMGFVLAEIYPGMGWSPTGPIDGRDWRLAVADIDRFRPVTAEAL